MSIRRLTLMCLAALGVAAGGQAVFGAQAWALNLYSPVGHFGSPGTGDGELSSPASVAVDNSTHDVYVIDADNLRVEKFTSSGTFLAAWGWGVKDGKAESEVCTSGCQVGIQGSGAGQFSHPLEIAVDNSGGPSAHDVYVADQNNGVVEKFSASGEYLSTLGPFGPTYGVAIDPAGNVWVSEEEDIGELSDLGVGVTSWPWPLSRQPQIAVDSEENVYGLTYQGAAVKLTSAGAVLDSDINSGGIAKGLAVDEGSNELFVTEEEGKSMAQYSATGKLLSRFGSFGKAGGVAVDSSDKMVYVADALDDQIDSFELLVNVPGAETRSISHSTQQGTTLNASVNPEGIPVTGCQFEYGPTTEYGKTASCSPALGSGDSPVLVSATVTGLENKGTYYFRVAATNIHGTNHANGVEFHYVKPPVVDAVPAVASNVDQDEATLNGAVDPQGVAASYRFVWGPTSAYGSLAPITELYTPVNETDDGVAPQRLVGLTPGTTYHFALVATNSAGTTVGPDETFTTPPAPVPGVGTGSVSEVTRTSATLTGTVDPEGQSTIYWFEYGTSTLYGGRYPATFAAAGEFVGVQGISITLPNLQPNTTYHYRLVAQDGAGTVYGADQTFTTAEFPASVIAETPVLKTPFGINPETKSNKIKSSGKGKHHKKKRKAKAKKKAKRGRKA